MKPAPIPPNDAQRIAVLGTYDVLDTLPEPNLDAITRLAAHICDVPIALISLIDADRQWFKSRHGLDAAQTPREVSFCGHVVADREPLYVLDALQDDRFVDNPLVCHAPHVRFYAGHPLHTHDDYILGTLCVIDHSPRTLTEQQQQMLSLLANQVIELFEFRAITHKIKSQQQRLETYGHFFDLSLELLCTVDTRLYFKELNPVWEPTLGYTLSELRARPLTDLVHPDDLSAVYAEAEKLQAGNYVTINFEVRFRRKSGDYRWLSWSATLKNDTFYATARDVTPYHDHRAALQASEATLRAVVESAADAIIVIDDQATIERINTATLGIFGYGAQELIGKHLGVLLALTNDMTLDRPVSAAVLFERRRTLFGVPQEIGARRCDQTTFPAEWVVNTMQIHDCVMYTVMLRDVTERKRVEKLQSEFVSTVSHELRTPLTAIRGSLGLLSGGLMGELDPKVAEMIDIAVSNSDRLVRLVNDILDIEKMQSGQMVFTLRPVELVQAVARAISATQVHATNQGVAISFAMKDKPCVVYADDDRLGQVLSNLLSNAIKFSPKGSVMTVSVGQKDNEHWRVSVQDCGPGISDAFKTRIFTRFAQADSSDSRQKGGTGLGLYICKTIIERMHGQIGFETPAGGGTCFYFDLPKHTVLITGENPNRTDKNSAVRSTHTEIPAHNRKHRILHIEDDLHIRYLVKQLVSQSWETTGVGSLSEARNILVHTTEIFDLILLDLILPDGAGEEILQFSGETPVVVYSARDVSETVAKQVHSVLVKTRVTDRELLQTLDRVSAESTRMKVPV